MTERALRTLAAADRALLVRFLDEIHRNLQAAGEAARPPAEPVAPGAVLSLGSGLNPPPPHRGGEGAGCGRPRT